MTLAVGPQKILEAYEIGLFAPIREQANEDMDGEMDVQNDFIEGYISVPLTSIWERRKVTPPKLPTELDNTIWYSILESVQEHDICRFSNFTRITTCVEVVQALCAIKRKA